MRARGLGEALGGLRGGVVLCRYRKREPRAGDAPRRRRRDDRAALGEIEVGGHDVVNDFPLVVLDVGDLTGHRVRALDARDAVARRDLGKTAVGISHRGELRVSVVERDGLRGFGNGREREGERILLEREHWLDAAHAAQQPEIVGDRVKAVAVRLRREKSGCVQIGHAQIGQSVLLVRLVDVVCRQLRGGERAAAAARGCGVRQQTGKSLAWSGESEQRAAVLRRHGRYCVDHAVDDRPRARQRALHAVSDDGDGAALLLGGVDAQRAGKRRERRHGHKVGKSFDKKHGYTLL